MQSVLVALALLSLSGKAYQKTDAPSPALFAENGANYSLNDGVLELRGGRGWLRTPEIYLDFWFAFEFRTTAPDTDAGVVVRTWTGQGAWPERGYRFRLPVAATVDGASAFEARRQHVAVIHRGIITIRPEGYWQQVEVTGAGRNVTVVLNETVVGVFRVDEFGGHVLIDNRKGRVEIRNARISHRQSPAARPDGLIRFDDLEKAAGQVPRVVREVKPSYTLEAVRRKVEGVVKLEAVILPDGSIGQVGILRSLDADLNRSAIAALKAWKFKPGLLNGKEVPVLAEVEMTFRLK